ncbi:MAG: hypothetical protein J7501_02855, partial [Bdellovibrio sp.]|nr:hypothetical protein [Bdellovibrio sp.]
MKAVLVGLFAIVLSSVVSANGIDKSFLPVPEWLKPKAAIMGGISDCQNISPYYDEYLIYTEALSRVVSVTYFTNPTCEAYIKSKIDTSNIRFV